MSGSAVSLTGHINALTRSCQMLPPLRQAICDPLICCWQRLTWILAHQVAPEAPWRLFLGRSAGFDLEVVDYVLPEFNH
jgi:hypothetical protein